MERRTLSSGLRLTRRRLLRSFSKRFSDWFHYAIGVPDNSSGRESYLTPKSSASDFDELF